MTAVVTAPPRCTAATFSRLPKSAGRAEHLICRPNHGPSSNEEAAMGQDVRSPRGPRCIALVGPFQSGKTTLLEAILARTGAIPKAGSVDAGTSVGDASAEARHHKMGVGLTAATTNFMGDSYTFIDCPGSIEFAHDMRAALPAVDAAVVVCEADENKLPQLQIILRELEDLGIPRFLFLNKIDKRQQAHPRDAGDPAAGVARAAGAAADSDLERRIDRRLRRSRAGARLRLSRAQAVRSGRSWKAAISTARRKRGSRCWRSSPITTTR